MTKQTILTVISKPTFVFVFLTGTFIIANAQGVAPPCDPDPLHQDAVMEWNCIAWTYAQSSTFAGPLRQIRAMAIVQAAIHNAVNGVTGRYEGYHRDPANVLPENASADAAAIGAAYQSLYGLLSPAQRVQLHDVDLPASLNSRGIAENDAGFIYGKSEGQNLVSLRNGDGSGAEAQCAYVDILNPQAGQWRRILNVEIGITPPAATPCWGDIPPFVLQSAEQFPLDGPPALDSAEYARGLLEVKNFGGQNSDTQREIWQTRVADFWDGSPIAITNQAIRQAAAAQGLDPSDKSRAFALVYLAGVDASIACFHYKYTKLFWRPETAINISDPLSNGAYWKPYLFPSHPHPEYPSGHSTNSGAMLSAAALVFGDEPGVTMKPTIVRNGITVTPQWNSFSQGIDEVVAVRVYSGLHFRFTDEASVNLARRIARFVNTHALRKCTNGNRCN